MWARRDYFVPNRPLVLTLDFFSPRVLNKGWPKKTDTRYKKFDVTNRVKLLEDILVSLTGIDDACHVRVELEKHYAPQEGTVVTFTPYVEGPTA